MEPGWEMVGGKRARAGAFVRTIIPFIVLAGLSSLFGAFPVQGYEPIDPDSPTCQNTTEEIQVCGKKENLTHLCVYGPRLQSSR